MRNLARRLLAVSVTVCCNEVLVFPVEIVLIVDFSDDEDDEGCQLSEALPFGKILGVSSIDCCKRIDSELTFVLASFNVELLLLELVLDFLKLLVVLLTDVLLAFVDVDEDAVAADVAVVFELVLLDFAVVLDLTLLLASLLASKLFVVASVLVAFPNLVLISANISR